MLEINENYIEKKWERAIDLLEMDQISRKKQIHLIITSLYIKMDKAS